MNSPKNLILPLLMLLNINYLFPATNIVLLVQLFLVSVVACLLWQKSKIVLNLSGVNLIVVINIIAAIRGLAAESININELVYTILISILFAVIASSIVVADNREDKITIYFSLSISVYVATCVLLYIFGLRPAVDVYSFDNVSRMGSWLGIEQRIHFPFTPGINSFGSIVGLSIVSTVACIIYAARYKTLSVFLLLFSIIAIIGVDSRGPLLYSIAAFPLGYLACNKFKIFAYLSLLLTAIFCLTILNISVFLGYAGNLIDILTGRPLIWFTAISSLEDFSFNHLVGYGMYGQAISEISYDYSKLFSSFDMDYPERTSLHNFALQSIFDVGVVGYMVIMAITFQSLYRFSKCQCNSCKVYTVVIVYLLLCGLTEPVPTIYSLSTFLVFLVAISFKHRPHGSDLQAAK